MSRRRRSTTIRVAVLLIVSLALAAWGQTVMRRESPLLDGVILFFAAAAILVRVLPSRQWLPEDTAGPERTQHGDKEAQRSSRHSGESRNPVSSGTLSAPGADRWPSLWTMGHSLTRRGWLGFALILVAAVACDLYACSLLEGNRLPIRGWLFFLIGVVFALYAFWDLDRSLAVRSPSGHITPTPPHPGRTETPPPTPSLDACHRTGATAPAPTGSGQDVARGLVPRPAESGGQAPAPQVADHWVSLEERRLAVAKPEEQDAPLEPGDGQRQPEATEGKQRQETSARGVISRTLTKILTWETIFLLAAVLVAAFFRFYRLDEIPFGVWYDEGRMGLDAMSLYRDGGLPVYLPSYPGVLIFYLIAASFTFLGSNVLAMRVVVATLGVATVPVLFVAVRRLAGPHVAIASAFLLAVSKWHVDFSRITFDAVFVPLLVFASIYFLHRGLSNARVFDIAVSGALAGLGWYTYYPMRLFPLIIAVLLLYRLVARPRAWKSLGLTVAVLGVAFLVVVAPLATFAVRYPEQFNQRLGEASVFAGMKTDAQKRDALISNVQKHLLMFNSHGDPNGRHNVPGEPMLDNLTAILFALGLGYALFQWRQSRFAVFLTLFVVMLSAGILSLAFEAPQGLRSFGVIPAVFVFAGLPFGAAWGFFAQREHDWEARLRRRLGSASATIARAARGPGRGRLFQKVALARSLLAVVPVALFFLIARDNFEAYFVRQANDFGSWSVHSTAETVFARRLAQLQEGDYDIYVSSLYAGHPDVHFLAPNAPPYYIFNVGSGTLLHTEKKGVMIFLEPQEQGAYMQLKKYYPNAKFEEIRPQGTMSGPYAMVIATIDREQIDALHGLEASYYQGEISDGTPVAKRREVSLDVDWSKQQTMATPFSVVWQATLYTPEYSQYRFWVEGSTNSRVFVDGHQVVGEDTEKGELVLASGTHSFRAEVTVPEPQEHTKVMWQIQGQEPEVIPSTDLYVPPVSSNGLLGKYYLSPDWSGQPKLAQIDPSVAFYFHLVPLPRPYSVEWVGKVYAPVDGRYVFGTEQISTSQLSIDGQLLVDNRVINQLREGAIQLTKGWHDLQLRFQDQEGYSHIYLYWTPPGLGRQIIPSEYLIPPQGEHADLALPPPLPAAPTPATTPTPGQAPAISPVPGFPTVRTVPATVSLTFGKQGGGDGEFNEPRDVAVDQDGNIYVVDTGNFRVQKFGPDGTFLTKWGRKGDGNGEFREPVALVVDSQGDVLVLDAESGWISRFDRNGKFKTRFAGPGARFYRPRGMAIDDQDNLYVADTGGCRVVVLDRNGTQTAVIGGKGDRAGEFLEPTDVLIRTGGEMVVVDQGNHRLERFDARRQFIAQEPLPSNIAASGVHLTAALDAVFATDPEGNRLLRLDASLRPVAAAGILGEAPSQFHLPVGIAADAQGSLYIADTLNHRIQKVAPFG